MNYFSQLSGPFFKSHLFFHLSSLFYFPSIKFYSSFMFVDFMSLSQSPVSFSFPPIALCHVIITGLLRRKRDLFLRNVAFCESKVIQFVSNLPLLCGRFGQYWCKDRKGHISVCSPEIVSNMCSLCTETLHADYID